MCIVCGLQFSSSVSLVFFECSLCLALGLRRCPGGSWRVGHLAARVSVSHSTFRGRDGSLKEYKGSLKIGSG